MAKSIMLRVVGMQHRITPSTRRMISKRCDEDGAIPVRLIREADNTHDENAIKVVIADSPYKGMHIGYVPRNIAAEYAPLIDGLKLMILHAELFAVDVENGEGTMTVVFKKRGKSPGKPRKKKSAKKA